MAPWKHAYVSEHDGPGAGAIITGFLNECHDLIPDWSRVRLALHVCVRFRTCYRPAHRMQQAHWPSCRRKMQRGSVCPDPAEKGWNSSPSSRQGYYYFSGTSSSVPRSGVAGSLVCRLHRLSHLFAGHHSTKSSRCCLLIHRLSSCLLTIDPESNAMAASQSFRKS